MTSPIGHPALSPAFLLPAKTPDTCGPGTDSALQGQQAAKDLGLGGMADFPHIIPPDHSMAGEVASRHDELAAALQTAKDDPEFAAAFFNELGPEATAAIISTFDALTVNGLGEPFLTMDEGAALLQDFGAALGAASQSGAGCFDGAGFMQALVNTRMQGGQGAPFDPQLAAILVSNGSFTPEAAAELGGYALLNADPPSIDPAEVESFTDHPHREALLEEGTWPVTLRALMANAASSEVLNVAGVANRLSDPALDDTSNIPALVEAILRQPLADLDSNPSDAAALGAVESLLLAGKHHHGDVNGPAANAFGALYMKFAPEILNAGEGSSAFPTATTSPLGVYLADSAQLQAGDGSFTLTAALSADGPPPFTPGVLSDERFDSWSEGLAFATANYRNEVEAHGPPIKDTSDGGSYPDLNALASEIADIDGEFLTGVYGAEAIKAADIDDANAHQQAVFNVISDYAGFAVGIGPQGVALSGAATYYNTHVEGAILEHFFPTTHAAGVFDATVPEHQQELLAAQAVRIVDSAARSGAVDLPPSLLDPETGGLRMPEAGDDAAQFAEDLAAFITGNDALHEAVDLARAQLEERTNALDMGQYRGGG